MPSFTTACPACGATLRLLDKYRGTEVQCPDCGEPFVAAPASAPRGQRLVVTSAPAPGEKVYYRAGGVRVTSARAILDGKSYAMAQITSVEAVEIPPNTKAAVALIVCGAILAIPTCGLALILLIVGIIVYGTARPYYAVCVASASGEAHALIGPDPEPIDRVVAAINQAIVERG
jgi:ribosomal protein S27E